MSVTESLEKSKRIYDYLDKLDRSLIPTLKPKQIASLPQFVDIEYKLISQYIITYKKKHTLPTVENVTDISTDKTDVDPNIPKTITTEWLEAETLKQYHLSTDPKDKQKYLDILQKIWCTKNKVPNDEKGDDIGMASLIERSGIKTQN